MNEDKKRMNGSWCFSRVRLDTVTHGACAGAARRWFAVMLACLGLCGAPSLLAQLSVSDAYVRGLPPGQSVTSAYLSLHNAGEEPLRVLQVSTPLAESIEFHRHSHDEGVMRMRRQDSLLVPAGGVLQLVPGQLHLMIFGLQRTLRDGELIPLRLCGEGFSCLDVQVPVVGVLREE